MSVFVTTGVVISTLSTYLVREAVVRAARPKATMAARARCGMVIYPGRAPLEQLVGGRHSRRRAGAGATNRWRFRKGWS
jgi:hypothetical protein